MDVMIDIETLGLVPRAVVTQIGVMPFDFQQPIYSSGINVSVDASSSLMNGGIVQAESLYWTAENNLKSLINTSHKSSLYNALILVGEYIKDVNPTFVWAKGPQFDCIILESWYNYFNIPVPWTYNQLRDVRTLEFLARSFEIDIGEIYDRYKDGLHDALHDCKLQIEVCKKVMENVSKRN